MMNQNINLELTLDEVNIILTALSKMPYAEVLNVLPKVQQQAQEQVSQTNVASVNGTEKTKEKLTA